MWCITRLMLTPSLKDATRKKTYKGNLSISMGNNPLSPWTAPFRDGVSVGQQCFTLWILQIQHSAKSLQATYQRKSAKSAGNIIRGRTA